MNRAHNSALSAFAAEATQLCLAIDAPNGQSSSGIVTTGGLIGNMPLPVLGVMLGFLLTYRSMAFKLAAQTANRICQGDDRLLGYVMGLWLLLPSYVFARLDSSTTFQAETCPSRS